MFFGCLPCCGGGCETHFERFGEVDLSVSWGFRHLVTQIVSRPEESPIITEPFTSGLEPVAVDGSYHVIDTGVSKYQYRAEARIFVSGYMRVSVFVTKNLIDVYGAVEAPQFEIYIDSRPCQQIVSGWPRFEAIRQENLNSLFIQNSVGFFYNDVVWSDVNFRAYDNTKNFTETVWRGADNTGRTQSYSVSGLADTESDWPGHPGSFYWKQTMRMTHTDAAIVSSPRFAPFNQFFELFIYDVYKTETGESVGLFNVKR